MTQAEENFQLMDNLISSAQRGDKGSISLLRSICKKAAERAPVPALIDIAKEVLRVGRLGCEKPPESN